MKDKLNLENLILDLVYHENYQPLKPRGIAEKLKLIDEEREVRRNIRRLVKAGRLAYGDKHRVINPSTKSKKPITNNKHDSGKTITGKTSTANTSTSKARGKGSPPPKTSTDSQSADSKKKKDDEFIGTFRRANAGFGFVTPQDSTATDRSDDIFIPKHKKLDAAHLDTVRIRVSRGHRSKRRDGEKLGSSGRVIEVIDRHTHGFVGTYHVRGDDGFVVVDGGVFESGILVGDAGAKNCKVGDKVVIEMVRFPSDRIDGEGVITEVLGDRGKPGVDTLSVIRQYGLPEEFPESVLENAREQAEAFNDGEIPKNRKDFTKTTVITIDPKTARDFDDAISLNRIENGHWELAVHIADVSHFVPYRSALDNEAYQRATSVYLPDRVIPMLPEIISNNLASLQPDRIRYCMTAVIEFTDKGIPVSTELFRGAINSAHRFNYEEIDDYLANDKPWKKKLTPEVFQLVRDMHTLAMMLRRRRMNGGAINLVLPEVKIELDDDGKVAGAHTVDNTESHQLIEEFMLAANEAVAQRMVDEKLFLMRRVHPQPSETKLADLTEFVRGLGIDCGNLQDRYEMKRVIEESEGMREQHAIHYAVLRSMQKAIYSPEEIGHYALNSDAYCHFTSPIRRYPDLIIHRMVGALIDGKKPDSNFERLAMLGNHCSELEKRAADAERELVKLKLLNFMYDKVGETMHAVITGVEAFGVFAQGVEIPAEGLIPLANLPDDSYQYDRTSRTLSGHKKNNQFQLGDKIEVRISVVDPDMRIMEFELAGVKRSPGNVARRSETKHSGKPSSGNRNERAKHKPQRDDRGKSKSQNKSSIKAQPNSKADSRGKSKGKVSESKGSQSKGSQSKGSESKGSQSKGRETKGRETKGSQSKGRGRSEEVFEQPAEKTGSSATPRGSSKRRPSRSNPQHADWESARASGPQKGHKRRRKKSASEETVQKKKSGSKSKKKTGSTGKSEKLTSSKPGKQKSSNKKSDTDSKKSASNSNAKKKTSGNKKSNSKPSSKSTKKPNAKSKKGNAKRGKTKSGGKKKKGS